MNTNFLSKFLSSIIVPPVTAESLTAYYASVPDGELHRLDPGQLTPLARPLWKAEVDRRSKARLTNARRSA